MKIKVKNLGVLKQAEFSLGDFTIICGQNNIGKTYATYALYGFLDSWRRRFDDARYIPDKVFDELMEYGITRINFTNYLQKIQEILYQMCKNYSSNSLHRVFATSEEKFWGSQFQIILEDDELVSLTKPISFERNIRAVNREILFLSKEKGSDDLEVSLLAGTQEIPKPPSLLKRLIAGAIHEIIFGQLFPTTFIVSAERTGAAIFRKELNFARNRLLKEMSQADEKIDPHELLHQSYQIYPLPVEKNVDFTRQLEDVAKQKSFLVDKHPEVLMQFADIIGGEYRVTRNDELYLISKQMLRGKRLRLSMDDSSSAVRSMLVIGFYLRHIAKRGDLLMVDEPELSLHPENQRRIARLFARLINLGLKVFITTHSDYIVKELNTLIMLNREKPHLKKIAKREEYDNSELLNSKKIKVYIAEEALVKLDGNQRRTRCHTLVEAKIDPELGIEARSFDTTIDEMNRIQDAILWEED